MIRTVGIVSLSSGMLGEDYVSRQREIGLKRLRDAGLEVRFLPHALMGEEYVLEHPEKRAEDLLQAFRDPEIDLIFCAIGGDDTYRLLPYLFEHDELRQAVTDKPFLGFSDTTINHFMLHRVGLKTFYGQSFLSDVCELGPEMLPYTAKYFNEFIASGTVREITPSRVWYREREGFGPEQAGRSLPPLENRGFVLLQGDPVFSGRILGGCVESMLDMFDGGRYGDMPVLCEKYGLFPDAEDWRGRILLLETSEEKIPPDGYRKALEHLRDRGVFEAVSGVLVGKPMDETYEKEYWEILAEVIADPSLPVLCNISVGHALPRCIVPFGPEARVDALRQTIRFPRDPA